MQVLVVDDDTDSREAIKEFLEAAGCSVVCAANGADGLKRLRGHPRPSVVLLDLEMPVMDGRQFCERQRTNPRLANVPVILLSASPRLATCAAELGVAGWHAKPARLPLLLAAMQRSKRAASSPSHKK